MCLAHFWTLEFMRNDDLNGHVFRNRNWCKPKSDRWFSYCNFDCHRPFHRKGFKWKKGGERGYFLKRRKFCMQSLTKERKQPPVVILQQAIFYNIFILCFWLKVVRRTNQRVWFINFPSQIFFYDVNHGHRAAILKKLFLAASVLYGCGYLLL